MKCQVSNDECRMVNPLAGIGLALKKTGNRARLERKP